jgi:hypothetical protein
MSAVEHLTRLPDDQLDDLADRIAERLAQPPAPPADQLVDARTLAAMLGVHRSWVYEHASALGAKRTSAKGRLRFDPQTARTALIGTPDGAQSNQPRRGSRRRKPRVGGVLQVRP